MTIPNGPTTGPPPHQPPYNPPPSSRSSIPRSVLVGGATAVIAIILVLVLVISLNGGGDDSDSAVSEIGAKTSVSTSSKATTFVPNLLHASFRSGWQNKRTKEPVTPPQRITITDSLDLTKEVEAIGYGPIEQSMPKLGKVAETDSSFPRRPAIMILPDANGDLHLSWRCETMIEKPAGANCSSYNMTLDISSPVPVVTHSAPTSVGSFGGSSVSLTENESRMSVSNPEELPESPLGTDKATGGTTVLMLSAVQPRESAATVYFLVPDSLKLYVGELESSR